MIVKMNKLTANDLSELLVKKSPEELV